MMHVMEGNARDAAEAIEKFGGRAYAASLKWSPTYGTEAEIKVGYFPTAEEADAQLAKALTAAGYEPRKWWQWWRWGETPPPGA